jgi:hypothetical protein
VGIAPDHSRLLLSYDAASVLLYGDSDTRVNLASARLAQACDFPAGVDGTSGQQIQGGAALNESVEIQHPVTTAEYRSAASKQQSGTEQSNPGSSILLHWPRCVANRAIEKRQAYLVSLGICKAELPVQADFLAAFTFAHRARCATAILLRALADMVRFLGMVTTFAFPRWPLTFAQRALWAAAILARPAAEILRRVDQPFAYAAPKADSAAPIAFISLLNRACSFLNICTTPLRFVIESPSQGL